jgi:hypothetical protein
VLSAAFVYELPFGQGKRFLNEGGAVNAILGGWQMSTIYRYSSGLPLYFRSSFCNVPGAFRAGCIPAIVNPGAVFAQDKGELRPGARPALQSRRVRADERVQLLLGSGEPRRRGRPGLRVQEPGPLPHQEHPDARQHERPVPVRSLQPVELAHLHQPGQWGGLAFNNDIASPNFGQWNGSVTEPRTMQVAVRFEF